MKGHQPTRNKSIWGLPFKTQPQKIHPQNAVASLSLTFKDAAAICLGRQLVHGGFPFSFAQTGPLAALPMLAMICRKETTGQFFKPPMSGLVFTMKKKPLECEI